MEPLLAVLLAVAVFVAVSQASARKLERARAIRLDDELKAARRATLAAPPSSEPESTQPAPGVSHDEVDAPRAAGELARSLALVREARAAAVSREARAQHARPDAARRKARELTPGARRAAELLESAARRVTRTARVPASPPPAEEAIEPASAMELLAQLARAAERLVDETARVKEDAGTLARHAARISEGAARATRALADVEEGGSAMGPPAAALSSLANRMNLLAINLAVLGTGAGNAQETGAELRALYEEARRISREVVSSSQRTADAARRARSLGDELAALASEGAARADRSLRSLAPLLEEAGDLGSGLERAREATLASELELRERGRRLSRARADQEAHSEDAARESAELAAAAASLEEALALVHELEARAAEVHFALTEEVEAPMAERTSEDARLARQLEGAESALEACAGVLAGGPQQAPAP